MYRFGLKENMTIDEMKYVVQSYTKNRKMKIIEAEVTRSADILRKHLNLIFILPTANIVSYNHKEPIEALIETFVEEELPSYVICLDRPNNKKFKSQFLKDLIIGDRHLKLHQYIYELKEYEQAEEIVNISELVSYANKKGMETFKRIKEN